MMREAFSRRAVTMHRMLNEVPGVSAIEPQGAFYCYPNFSSLLGRPLGPNGTVSATTLELADSILGEAKVAFVPGEAFGTPGYARFSFAMAEAEMEEGIRRIHQWVTTS
jgi:aspartate/methionine/tyrosine aminotransferase